MQSQPLPLLRPDIFSDHAGVVAAFSTRRGGVSPAPYASLNLGGNTEDEPKRVEENRRRVLRRLGFESEEVALGGQVHGSAVRYAAEPGFYEATDGLVTDVGGLVLAIQVADCAAVLLADPEAKVIGACHAGWRGAVAGIAGAATEQMRTLGARPERILAYVSPCISVEHFEVGPEVAARFKPAHLRHPDGAPRPFVDLKAAVADQLEEAGLLPEHIEVSEGCTVSDTEAFFSYRAEGGVTGRMMGFIALR